MKKVLSILLVAVMLFTMVPAGVFAADGTSVKLVSFMRGDVSDLRSSELLEVQVEGYEGNPRELTYKWTSSLGTYLYIYNSHNMYGINNTYGEYEIYNTDKKVKRNSNVEEDRSGDKTLSKVGFMWASVYGAYTYNGGSASTALKGTVKVEVFDKNGTSLGSDSFSGFKVHNLDSDLDNVVIGLFEGDRKNALDLLGESGIVHITCDESKVSSADILSGDDHIAIETEEKDKNTFNYFIKGVKAGEGSTNGDAQLEINIKKTSCKFHYNTSGSANPIVYVFKKPTTSTTTTTLTLDKDSLDGRCEYFIDGNKGEEQTDGSIVFTGLTPNTEYTVEVRAEYKDSKGNTKYVYAYVDDTTKPEYKATVKTYLDSVITDITSIHGDDVDLFLSKDGQSFVELTKTATGTYEATVEPGTYFPYHYEDNDYHQARNYELIIEHSNAELHLHHYSVKYDTNGGAFKAGEEVDTEIYSSMSAVNATSNVPVREGFIFTGWEYSSKIIGSGKQITSSISAPITLKAKWEKAVNVTINVTIDHKTVDGFDPNPTRADLDVDFLEMTSDSPAFVETGDKLHFREDKVTDGKGNTKAYTYSVEDNKSTYTATDFTYTGLLESSTFGVALSKSGYDVGTIEKKQDKLGNWTINIPLTYNPDDFDLDFSIEMADDVPSELYPDAVIVKVAYWNTETNEWKIISQQENVGSVVKPGVRVDIDPTTGEGFGSYPVWRFDGKGDVYGYRAVVTGFIYGDSTIIVPTEKDHYKDDNTVIVTYTDGNYTATMSDIADGKKFSTSLNGAYYNSTTNAQQGTLHGVISVEKYDVTFDANGGTIKDNDTYTETDEYYVPDTKDYVPTFDGHEFEGWYKDPEFKEPVTDGEILKENVTFYAKWDRILTGNVVVAGSYMQDGNIVDVWSVDRAESAVVVLQEITENGVYNIDRQTVNIVWPMSEMIYGISEEYKFTGLDPEKEYRTEVIVLNYGSTYQNSTTVVIDDGDYANDYNANDFEAVYPESSKWETFVNAYLSFEPSSYFQPVEVDATLIGANLRPDNTLVQVWYKATGTNNPYQVISQHTVVPYGIEVGMGADGMDDSYYGYLVWNSLYNGNLYDYQAYLDKINGKEVSEWPVSVVYGAPSRYSPLNNAATGTLQVKIIPNRYDIIYNENYVDEGVNIVSHGTHTWSHKTVLDYVPVREGYIFQGWYSDPECESNKVTEIDENVAEHTNLYAKWEAKTGYELTVNYVEKLTDNLLETEIKSCTYDDVVTAESLKKDFEGYTYDSASAESVIIGKGTNEITLYYTKNSYSYTVNYLEEGSNNVLSVAKNANADFETLVTEEAIAIDGYTVTGDTKKTITIKTENNVINFYYAVDSFGGGEDGDDSDGTPDKYQKKVIFKVQNGMWSNGETEDTFQIVTLVKDGKYSVDGTATINVPTGMIANKGYGSGSWDVTPPVVVSGTDTETYTYIFKNRTDLGLKVNYVGKDSNELLETETKTSLTYGEVITSESLKKDFKGYSYISASADSITIGTEINEITLYYVKNNYNYTVNYFLYGTTDPVAESKNVADVPYGKTVTETAPEIKGYTINGDKVKSIVIDTENNVINFYYSTASYTYTVNYLEEGTNKVLKTAKKATVTYGTSVTESYVAIDDYVLVSDEKVNLVIDEAGKSVTFYYALDTVGRETNPNNSDGIPDKYQKEIVFKVVNGTWENGKSTDIVKYVTLKTDGKYDINGTASLTAPTGMTANSGYEGGAWDVTPPVVVSGTDKEIYTYEFVKIPVPENPDDSGNTDTPDVPGGEGDGDGSVSGGAHHIVFGKTDGIGWYNVSKDGGKTWDLVFGNSTYEVENGTELIIKAGDIMGDSFTFYVNGDAVKPDDNNEIRVTVNGYMLIGAIGIDPDIDFEVPDVEESLNWFQKIIKAIKDFFAMIGSWFK